MSSLRKGRKLLVVIFAFALLAAACGDDNNSGDEGSGTTATPDTAADVPEGGTVTYASDQEPTGWNVQHGERQPRRPELHDDPRLPAGLRHHAGLRGRDEQGPAHERRADQRRSADDRVQDQPGRGLVGRHADQRRGLHLQLEAPERQGRRRRRRERSRGRRARRRHDPRRRLHHRLREHQVGRGRRQVDVTVTFEDPLRGLEGPVRQHHAGAHPEGRRGLERRASTRRTSRSWSGGPFKFTDYEPEKSVTMVPNDKFWGEKPHIDKLVVVFGILPEALPEAFQNGEIDLAYPQPQVDLVQRLEEHPRDQEPDQLRPRPTSTSTSTCSTSSSPIRPCARRSPTASTARSSSPVPSSSSTTGPRCSTTASG